MIRTARGVRRGRALAGVAWILAATTACGSNHRLGEYDFRDTTVAVVAIPSPSMEFFSALDLRLDRSDPVRTAIRVGSGIAREVSLADFRPRADSAAANVDVSRRTADRAFDGILRSLRGRPAEEGVAPDFELEFRVDTWGFVADGWGSQAYLNLRGDLFLLDGATGRTIWRSNVRATNPLGSTGIFVNDPSLGNVVTAARLASYSREEVERELEILADIAADALVDRFRRDLDEAREGG